MINQKADLSFGDAVLFVSSLYRNVLGRAGLQSEVAPWADQLAANLMTEDQLTVAFATGEEATDAISQVFRTNLNTAVSEEQLAAAQSLLEGGISLAALSSTVAAAAAAQRLASAQEFVRGLYQTDLGRVGSSVEIDPWADQLAANLMSEGQLSVAFARGGEAASGIAQIYVSNFGRPPNVDELASAQASLETGTSLQSLFRNATASTLAAKEFVSGVYVDDLGRQATQIELDSWAALLVDGVLTRAQIVSTLATSVEAVADIKGIYQTALGYAPSADQLSSAQTALEAGATLAGIRDQVIAVGAATKLAAAELFVSNLYQSDLGRIASQAEVIPWANLVAANIVTTSQLIVEFATCPEATADITALFEIELHQQPNIDQITSAQAQMAAGTSLEGLRQQLVSSARSATSKHSSASGLTIDSIHQSSVYEGTSPLLSMSGTSSPGMKIVIHDLTSNGTNIPIGLATADTSGAWTFTYSGGLGIGDNRITAAELSLPSSNAQVSNAESVLSFPIVRRISSSTFDGERFGIFPGTGHDETKLIQNALNSLSNGQTLVLSAGTYELDAPLVMKSDETLEGYGALFQAGANYIDGAANPTNNMMIRNENLNASSQEDHQINILGISFDYGNYDWGGTHAIRLVGVNGINVQDCNFKGGNDGTAFLNCSNTIVNNCVAIDTHNAAFDSWEGSGFALVENSTAKVAGGYGILFNSVGTDGTNYTASNVTAVNNNISANNNPGTTQAAIWVAPLGDGSAISNALVSCNNISGFASGVVVDSATNVVVYGNVISDGTGPTIMVRPSMNAVPDVGLIANNSFLDNKNEGSVAEVQIYGDNYVIQNNKSVSNYEPTFGWVAGKNDTATGNIVYGNVKFLYNTSGSQNFSTSDTIANIVPVVSGQADSSQVISPVFLLPSGGQDFASFTNEMAATNFQLTSRGVSISGSSFDFDSKTVFNLVEGDSIDLMDIAAPTSLLVVVANGPGFDIHVSAASQHVSFSAFGASGSNLLNPTKMDDGHGGTIVQF